MNATAENGDVWIGEQEREGQTTWYLYQDRQGRLYESREAPVYRIDLRHITRALETDKARYLFTALLAPAQNEQLEMAQRL